MNMDSSATRPDVRYSCHTTVEVGAAKMNTAWQMAMVRASAGRICSLVMAMSLYPPVRSSSLGQM
jgi:hypothetical protein